MKTAGRNPNPPGQSKDPTTKIHLDADIAERLRELSIQTRLPMAELTRRLLTEALDRVVLVPATVYNIEIK